MDAGAVVVGLLEEVVQIVGQAGQVVAVVRAGEDLAEERGGGPVLRGLEDQFGRGGHAQADAVGVAVTQDGDGDVGAMAAVHVPGAVIVDAGETGVGLARPVVDGHDAAGRDVRMGPLGGAITQAGVRHSHDLGGAVVAVGPGRVGPHDHAAAVLVVLLGQDEVLDPGHVQHLGHGLELGLVGGDDELAARAVHQQGDPLCDGVNHRVRIHTPLDAHGVEAHAIPFQGGAQLVAGLEDAHPLDRAQVLDLVGLGRGHPHLEGEVRQVLQELRAGGRHLLLPGLLHRSLELDDVVAQLVRGVAGEGQALGQGRENVELRNQGAHPQQDGGGRLFLGLGAGLAHTCAQSQGQDERQDGETVEFCSHVLFLQKYSFDKV